MNNSNQEETIMTNEKFRLTRKSGKIVSMISATSLLVGTFFGCSSSNSMNSDDNLTSGMEFKKTDQAFTPEVSAAMNEFTLKLFKNLDVKDQNILLSGSSAWMALGMAANGADGQTLKQIEAVLGLNRDQINKAASAFFSSLENQKSLTLADSIWLKSEFRDEVSKSFLENCAGDFRAEVFSSTFDQESVKDINTWVQKNTDDLIKDFLMEIPSMTQMILINAQAFDGTWKQVFEESETRKQKFHNQDGSLSSVDFLNGYADWSVENDQFVGFIKDYDESKYGYMLLMPKDENEQLSNVVDVLDGSLLTDLLKQRMKSEVRISMPKLNQESTLKLNDALKASGLEDAFSKQADFTSITDSQNDLYISEVLQKTFIEVNEKGTKAAAATEIGIETMSMPIETEPVIADRPYLYMVVDLENSLPLFIGQVVNITE